MDTTLPPDGVKPAETATLRPGAVIAPGAAIAAAAALVLVAFPSSIARILDLAVGYSADALSVGVLVFAGVWAWLSLRAAGGTISRPGRRELAASYGGLALAALIQWLAPRGPSGGTGPWHLDLHMVPVFAASLAVLAGGWRRLKGLAGPVAMLALLWPPAAALVAMPFSRPMLAVSRWAGAGLARASGVGVEAVPGARGLLACTGAAGTHLIAVAPACSGAGGVLAVLVAAAPVVALARGSWRRKALWVIAGSAAVGVFAPVRVAVLCRLAAERGVESAFGAFHHLSGTAFFILAWVAMLALTRPFGLAPPPLARIPGARWRPSGREGWATLAAALALAAVAGAGNVRLHARSRAQPAPRTPMRGADDAGTESGIVVLDEPALPPARGGRDLKAAQAPTVPEVVADHANVDEEDPGPEAGPQPFDPKRPGTWMRDIPGFERWPYRSMPWTRSMYGKRSRMERLACASRVGGFYWIDALALTDPALLDKHTVHGCFTWHGWTVESFNRIEIAPGVRGESFVHVDADGRRWASVTWAEPIAPGWWLRLHVQRRVRDGAEPRSVLEKVSVFAPLLRLARDEEEGPF